MPSDPLAAAQPDEVFEGAQELFRPLNPPVSLTGDQFAASREACLPVLHARFADFELLLARHGGPFFLGSDPCYCDFGAFHHIDLAHFMDEAILEDYPRLGTSLAMHGLRVSPPIRRTAGTDRRRRRSETGDRRRPVPTGINGLTELERIRNPSRPR